jgi:hypothetical protein
MRGSYKAWLALAVCLVVLGMVLWAALDRSYALGPFGAALAVLVGAARQWISGTRSSRRNWTTSTHGECGMGKLAFRSPGYFACENTLAVRGVADLRPACRHT